MNALYRVPPGLQDKTSTDNASMLEECERYCLEGCASWCSVPGTPIHLNNVNLAVEEQCKAQCNILLTYWSRSAGAWLFPRGRSNLHLKSYLNASVSRVSSAWIP